jgi:hypothetical protein
MRIDGSGNCVANGGGGGGGGSSGGSGSFTPTVPQIPTQPSNCPKGYVCKPNATITPPGSVVISQLNLGSKGTQVTRLKWLLSNGTQSTFTTDVLDQATLIQLQSFQCKNLYVCSGTPATTGYGSTGPKTRTALANLTTRLVGTTPVNSTPVPNIPSVTTSIPSTFRFTHAIKQNTYDSDVRYLQMFLNSRGFAVASSGPGSKGNESTYYGPATIKALAAFQKANNITPAIGNFGPVTQAKVNVMLASNH